MIDAFQGSYEIANATALFYLENCLPLYPIGLFILGCSPITEDLQCYSFYVFFFISFVFGKRLALS